MTTRERRDLVERTVRAICQAAGIPFEAFTQRQLTTVRRIRRAVAEAVDAAEEGTC